jgi:hypothetical protein
VVQRRMPGIYVLHRIKADQEHRLPPLHLDQENLPQLAVLSYDHISHLIIPDPLLGSFTPLPDLNNHIVVHPLHPNHLSLRPVPGPFHQHSPTLELLHPALLLLRSKINHHLHHVPYDLVLAGHLINWQRLLQMMEVQARSFRNLETLVRMENRPI